MTLPPDGWKPNELALRKKEINTLKWGSIGQVVASVATIAAVVVALSVAIQGQESLKNATQYNLQQALDSQLSTAITSIGSGDIAERIAGLVLLRSNAADRLTPKSTTIFGKQSAFIYYTAALEIYSGYLSSHGREFLEKAKSDSQLFGLGYGTPPPGLSIDIQYAIDEIKKMLKLGVRVDALDQGVPALDLANDELYEQNLSGIDFSAIVTYMPGIDLRGAVLTNSHLNKLDDLDHSYLQCADLSGANLKGAKLEYADLRGADLTGAQLQHADLRGAELQGADVQGANFSGAIDSSADFKGIYGSASGLQLSNASRITRPLSQSACLNNTSYWDEPAASPSPASTPSATPSPNATHLTK